MLYIGAKVDGYSHGVVYVSDENVVDVFMAYNKGFEGFYYFCKGEFCWRSPNADMLRFIYSPMSAQKIDWVKIYEDNKHKFNDFSAKLDKDFYKAI